MAAGGKVLSAVLMYATLVGANAGAFAGEKITIAALGDSLTQGYGLVQNEGFTAQLQSFLTAAEQDVEILNAGVSGDTTAGGLARVDWTLTPDVDAMIVTLGGNDILRGIAPAQVRANIDGILAKAASKDIPVLLIGMEVPANYGLAYQADFAAIYPDLAAEYDTLYVESFMQPLLELGTLPEVLATYFQRDGIHPNAKGVAIVVQALGPKVIELAEQVRAEMTH